MHIRTAALVAAGALAATLTACSSDGDPSPTVTVTKTVTAGSGEAPGESAKPAAGDDGALDLGEPWSWEASSDGEQASGTTTALAYKQPIKGITPPDIDGKSGEVWGQVEAKVCVDEGVITASQFPWSLAFADGARVDVTGSSGGDFPRPEFPMDAIVKAGDCVRGLIMFPVPEGQRPEKIIYSPDANPEGAEWSVPAK